MTKEAVLPIVILLLIVVGLFIFTFEIFMTDVNDALQEIKQRWEPGAISYSQ